MIKYDLNEIRNSLKGGVLIKRIVDENNKDVSDAIKLSIQEKRAIFESLESLKKFRWTEQDAKKLNLDRVSLISFDSSNISSLENMVKYRIIPPIYFRNNQYCILSFSYGCGALCGHGQITIYKLAENGWRRWDDLSWWDE